ncbi:MAG: hypothetical protein ACE5WD_09635 [Candidatus Aminicenantia bacterium]
MKRKDKLFIHLFTLGLFLVLALFIDFFHTETSLLSKDFCPACNFHNSSITNDQINFFSLPQLFLLEILLIFYSFNYQNIDIICPSSRSPPYI